MSKCKDYRRMELLIDILANALATQQEEEKKENQKRECPCASE
jgi:hypothetical protein